MLNVQRALMHIHLNQLTNISRVMKTKKYIIALAIFGGAYFTAQATDLIDLNGQTTTDVDRRTIKIPRSG